ncbi:MAG: hypothetical protein ISQ03_00305 [Pseudomonadales bacterium]|nr:hypothetical protein [Pseudomonadales bacterium]
MRFVELERQARSALRAQLDRPPQAGLAPLLETLQQRYGASLLGVLYYGSCRREDTLEGLVDFHVLVSDFRSLPRGLAWAGAVLPPNVFYLEVPGADGSVLRCKYALLTERQFFRGCSRLDFFPYFWARYAQPMSLLACPDPNRRAHYEVALLGASETLLGRTLPGVAKGAGPEDLWRAALARTYGTELRPEGPGRGDDIVAREATFFRALAGPVLAREGFWRARRSAAATRWAWRARAVLGKPLALARLLKALGTFEGALDYAAWKLERHSGAQVRLTPRLRRYPWLLLWPELWRLWRGGYLK